MPLQANLRHVIYALSDALDLVGVDDLGHGKRVGLMASACCEEEAEAGFCFDLGLLHDIGVSSTRVHQRIRSAAPWQGAQDHCDRGFGLLDAFPPLAALALPVKHHHTPWTALSRLDLDPVPARRANLIHLVDRVDALAAAGAPGEPLLLRRADIRARIQEGAGTEFAPDLVHRFLEASGSEAFWLQLEPRAVQSAVQDHLGRARTFDARPADLLQLAEIFSRIVDAKSPFTADHSAGVAGVAHLLARKAGLDGAACDKVQIAGLLHDLGKLRVPDEILDKPGGLDARERQIINTHSYETFQILRHIPGFEEITPWAACHHEEPGGTGYPFRLDGRALPLEARLIRVADLFQAMVQNRPYREGLDRPGAFGFLRGLVARGRLEADLVDLLASCGDEAMRAARAAC